MMSSRNYPTRGIVLRTRAIGEKDRVLVLLTQEHGKISASARGSRNPKSKLAAAAQTFTLARFLIARGRSLDIVAQAQIEDAHTHISGELIKTAWASYFCELCDAVPEELPDRELFELLRIALHTLNYATPDDGLKTETIGRWFEAQYLAHLGYSPMLGRCVVCERKISVPPNDAEQLIPFSPLLGGTVCRSCSSQEANLILAPVQSLRALHQLQRADAPQESIFSRLQLAPAARRSLKEALQRTLDAHISARWRSRAFLEEVLEQKYF